MVIVRWSKSKSEATLRWLVGGVASLLLLRSIAEQLYGICSVVHFLFVV